MNLNLHVPALPPARKFQFHIPRQRPREVLKTGTWEVKSRRVEKIWRHVGTAIRLYYPL